MPLAVEDREGFYDPEPKYGNIFASGQAEDKAIRTKSTTARTFCEESAQLLEGFAAAVRELMLLHEEQLSAIIGGDPQACRFDILIHEANEKKQNAKYAYMRHSEIHGCPSLL